MAKLRRLLGELEEIGWENVDFEDFSSVNLLLFGSKVAVDLAAYPSVSINRIAASCLVELYQTWKDKFHEWQYIETALDQLKAYFVQDNRLELEGYCTVDVQVLCGKPLVNFNGPVQSVRKYTEMHATYQWDPSVDYLANLQAMFRCKFTAQKADASAECGICMALELDGYAPMVKCPSDKCGQVYHESCVREWFTSISRQSKWIIGACPYCSHTITLAA